MELRQLRYVVTVAEEGTFRRAAERLQVTPQALSQQVGRLERDLGTELFLRTAHAAEPTDAGRALVEQARRVLAEATHAESVVAQAARGELGRIRVGFVSSAALGVMPRIVLAMQRSWPGLRIELEESVSGRQLDDVAAGRLDAGIVREVTSAPGLRVTPLLRERLVVAVHRSHPLAKRRTVRLRELGSERFLAFPRRQVSRLYDHIAALCHRAGFHLEPAQEAIQFPTLLGLVAANMGVTIVPDSMRALRLHGLRYLELDDREASSTVSVVSRPDREQSPALRRFLETASAVAPS
ncbi:MAG: LysR family transcriptional regulator [Streptosporangiales bacterium]|nr:LysR family transcriptional regulator [Streptosporangiales bacterium]